MTDFTYFSRDVSWLYFNGRVLQEAANPAVPLGERILFLSIFSSNLDEFFRVRMPVLMALDTIEEPSTGKQVPGHETNSFYKALDVIYSQQQQYGNILITGIIPQLQQHGVTLVYNTPIPGSILPQVFDYFFSTLAAYIEAVDVEDNKDFFPGNNKLYLVVLIDNGSMQKTVIVNIPSDGVPRFYAIVQDGIKYILFIDDIIKACLPFIFKNCIINGAYNIKITRDAELDLQDEYAGDIAQKIEEQINKRDMGLATRLLYQPGIPLRCLQTVVSAFNLFGANKIEGGNYHNLKDFASFPLSDASLFYAKRTPVDYRFAGKSNSLYDEVLQKDILVHTPYNSYNTVLRFFNEAAIDKDVTEIYTTMYRVASDSRIVHALISAARNGKKVTAFVELKARFDEANNIKWGKRMKEAGVKIIYSIPRLKVHAKVALVKKKLQERTVYLGLFATGNLNESTARFYTDHILLTGHKGMLSDLELVFMFLAKRKKPGDDDNIAFNHLLVAQFNLQQNFLQLIDAEIANAKQGLPSGITIKLNNLEERVLISKLYEASCAGVKINLFVRSICCLVPGVKGMSENIAIKRIVDRYLEHGRVFIFNNNNNELVFLGSSDWMNRNVYRRIEVCFPVYDKTLKQEIKDILQLQLQDDEAAVMLDDTLNNIPIINKTNHIRSQDAIYNYCLNKANLA